ncbi:hypothetical protein SAMN05421823_11538 [Catalinimonas alkaloidigena]|uniref:Uncharacterized protein n=1 Tax=Catalinimonas alkaloidigena TaxID=1075417 RepID=A0A1G9TYZ9_9BACT|nr:alpha/beta fold hydrolase [Catalinimonas alkaloidigena]SDM52957.1 hypothetical protein SAMN05421823_11538 [Catalinimonas alkaloidigena]
MSKHVLFIQGGGEEGFKADATLVASLQTALGGSYQVHYPRLTSDETQPDFGWPQQIEKEIRAMPDPVWLVGHSLGASMLLKCLTERPLHKKITGLFLLATPFWSGEEAWQQGLALQEDFPDHLPKQVPIFLYHCRDDEEVSFEHLSIYAQKLPQATVRALAQGGHPFQHALALVTHDVKSV